MINLVLTDKEAACLHMVYLTGAYLLAGEAPQALVMSMHAIDFVQVNMTDEEVEALKLKITRLAEAIPAEVRKELKLELFTP